MSMWVMHQTHSVKEQVNALNSAAVNRVNITGWLIVLDSMLNDPMPLVLMTERAENTLTQAIISTNIYFSNSPWIKSTEWNALILSPEMHRSVKLYEGEYCLQHTKITRGIPSPWNRSWNASFGKHMNLLTLFFFPLFFSSRSLNPGKAAERLVYLTI